MVYVFVGGIAARAHGATRLTYDMDLLSKPGENLERLAAALTELHAGLRISSPGGGTERLEVPAVGPILEQQDGSTWVTDAGPVDVLIRMRMTGGRYVSYDDVIARARPGSVDSVSVVAVGLDDLIAAKEGADRPKDHEALRELRALRDTRPTSPGADER